MVLTKEGKGAIMGLDKGDDTMALYGPYGPTNYMPAQQPGTMQPTFYPGMQPGAQMPINPYMNNGYPGTNNMQAQQQAGPKLYDYVNGIEGAMAYQNKSQQPILLMDSDNPLLYVKQANALGQNSILFYHTEQVDEATARSIIGSKNAQMGQIQGETQKSIKYATLEQVSAIEAKIDKIAKQLESFSKKETKESKKEA